jgi:hypothetical protein
MFCCEAEYTQHCKSTPNSPAGTNDNGSFDTAAGPALGRGDFGEFAIQHSRYLHSLAIWLLN